MLRSKQNSLLQAFKLLTIGSYKHHGDKFKLSVKSKDLLNFYLSILIFFWVLPIAGVLYFESMWPVLLYGIAMFSIIIAITLSLDVQKISTP